MAQHPLGILAVPENIPSEQGREETRFWTPSLSYSPQNGGKRVSEDQVGSDPARRELWRPWWSPELIPGRESPVVAVAATGEDLCEHAVRAYERGKASQSEVMQTLR